MEFMLYELLDVESLTRRERYAQHTRETFDSHRSVRFTDLAPHAEWSFEAKTGPIAITSALTRNQADAAIDACAAGIGLGLLLS